MLGSYVSYIPILKVAATRGVRSQNVSLNLRAGDAG